MKFDKRYFVDCHAFDKGGQGMVTHILGIYKSLIPKCQDIQFFLAASDILRLKYNFSDNNNIKFIKYKFKNKFLRMLVEIPLLIIRYKISTIHLQYYMLPYFFVKKVTSIHDLLFIDYRKYFPLFYSYKNKILFYFSILFSDYIITVSNYSKKQIYKNYPSICHKKIEVIPNAVVVEECGKFAELMIKTKYILYVSRIERRKNHIALCKAFLRSRLLEKYNLVIVGRNDLGSVLFNKFLDTLNACDRNRLLILGGVLDEEIACLYKNASLFVFPSLCEGFGIPPLEAVVCNCSTICAYNTAMKDFYFFKDRFFNASSVKEIAEKMEKYVDNNENMEIIKEIVLSEYNQNKVSDIFISRIIKNIYNSRGNYENSNNKY